MKKYSIPANKFRCTFVKTVAKKLHTGEFDRIEITYRDNPYMFAELYTTDENLPTVSSVMVKGNSAAIFELVATFKVPIVITSARDSSFPLMVLRPAIPNIDSCWRDIAKLGEDNGRKILGALTRNLVGTEPRLAKVPTSSIGFPEARR